MRFFIAAGLILVLTVDVLAAKVELNSGKVIEGTITSKTDQKITIDPGIGVAVSYYKEDIATIDGQPFAAGNPTPEPAQPENGSFSETDNSQYLRVKQLYKENYIDQGFDRYPSPVIDQKMLIPLENDPAILNILEKNRSTILVFQEAAVQDNSGSLLYKSPMTPNAQTAPPVKLIFELLKLNNLNLLQSRYALAQSDYASAEKSIAASLDFMIQLAAQRPAALLASIMNNIVFDKTEPLLQIVLEDQKFNPIFLDQIITKLIRLDQAVSLKDIQEGERKYTRATLDSYEARAQAKGSYDSTFWETFNRKFEALKDEETTLLLGYVNNEDPSVDAKKELGAWRATLTEVVGELKNQLTAPENPEDFPFPQDPGSAEKYATLLYLWTSAKLETQLDFLNAHIAKHRNYMVSFALRKYRTDNGRYPDDLGALVPKYLAEIPKDMFDAHRPLKYVREGEGYRVYSLGPDRINQSGLMSVDFSDAGYGGDKTKNHGDVVLAYGEKGTDQEK